MEGGARIDLEESCTPLALDLGSKLSETKPYIGCVNGGEGPDNNHSSEYSADKRMQFHDGEPASMSTFPENDKKQVIPFTISLSSGIMESNVAVVSEVSAALQLVSVKAAMPENVFSHSLYAASEGCNAVPAAGIRHFCLDALPPDKTSCLPDTRPLQLVTSAVTHGGAEQPLHISLASDGSTSLQLATSAPLVPVPGDSSKAEHRLMASEERIAFRKDKVKKRPRQLLQDARTRDLNKSGEKQPVIRWKDVWVAQLIHIRGRMHSTFTSPQRQRVDLWQIVKNEMTSSCHGFDKDSEACRKKWIRVYKEYKDDRRLSNDERTQKCRFYDLVDFYMGDRANGFRKMHVQPEFLTIFPDVMHAAKNLTVTPLPPSNEVDVKAVNGRPIMPQVSSDTSLSKPTSDVASKKSSSAKKSWAIENPLSPEQLLSPRLIPEAPCAPAATSKRLHMRGSVQTLLSELVNIGKELLQTTRDFEKEKLAVLYSIEDTLGKIAKAI